jgi:hypothetical protein
MGSLRLLNCLPDGHYLAFSLAKFAGLENCEISLHVARIAEDMKSELDIDNAEQGKFSPDGRWLAFHDNIGGQYTSSPFLFAGGGSLCLLRAETIHGGVATARNSFMSRMIRPSSQSSFTRRHRNFMCCPLARYSAYSFRTTLATTMSAATASVSW